MTDSYRGSSGNHHRGYAYDKDDSYERQRPRSKRFSGSHSYDDNSGDRSTTNKRYRRGKDDYYYGDYTTSSSRDRSSSSYYDGDDDGHRGRREDEMQQPQQQDDWKCLECKTWNYPEDSRCARCGLYPEDEYYYDDDDSSRLDRKASADNNNNHDDEETDEFGRRVVGGSSSSPPQKKKKQHPPPRESRREWPPHFDKSGSDYVFDARSGMFYEAESDFFYDPKSKLYYGNKKGAYFKYNQEAAATGESVPFEQVQKVDPAETNTTTDLEAEPALAPQPKKKMKKGISIKLTTKSLKVKKEKGAAAAAAAAKGTSEKSELQQQPQAPASRQQKQYAVDMDKWSDRQIEKRQAVANDEGEKKPEQTTMAIKRTAKGEPMCDLCRRKFPSVDKLLYHFRVSKLHKENLAKQQQKAQAKPAETKNNPSTNYVDRAEQRRMMHGPETPGAPMALPPLFPPSSSNQGPPTTAAAPPMMDPKEHLGEANIGNQLLQKMGWKAGNPVGRPERPETTTTGGAPPENSSKAVVKEWERIEALAANGGRQKSSTFSSSHIKPGVGS